MCPAHFLPSKLDTHPTRPQKGVPKKRPNPPGHCKNGTQEPLLEGSGLDTPFRPPKKAKTWKKKDVKIDAQNQPQATRVQGLKIARNTAPVHKNQGNLRFEDFKKTAKNKQK